MEAQLIQVGIETPEALREIGAKAAWLKIQEIDPSTCIHRLLALEGAIQGVKKTVLPDAVKADLKVFYGDVFDLHNQSSITSADRKLYRCSDRFCS